jgi:hypothetical protein
MTVAYPEPSAARAPRRIRLPSSAPLPRLAESASYQAMQPARLVGPLRHTHCESSARLHSTSAAGHENRKGLHHGRSAPSPGLSRDRDFCFRRFCRVAQAHAAAPAAQARRTKFAATGSGRAPGDDCSVVRADLRVHRNGGVRGVLRLLGFSTLRKEPSDGTQQSSRILHDVKRPAAHPILDRQMI